MNQKLVLRTSGPRLTGRKQTLRSPLTGQITTYHETFAIYVSEPAPTTPDIDALKEQINNDMYGEGVDGFCDEILLVQGVLEDTYKPRVWMAEDQPQLRAQYPRLIAPILAAAIILTVGLIITAIAIVVSVYILAHSFTTLSRYILQPPEYVGGTDPDNPEVYESYAEYCSAQNLNYWYVCPKCCAGFGSKTEYPNIEDVPQAIVDRFNEHVENCLGIPQGPQHVEEFLIWAVIGVGGFVGVVWLVSTVLGRTAEKVVVLPTGRS